MGDAFIAATALFLNIQLFTFNNKDFRFITNLKLYEP
jgi:predicted nucleic acid-binding protein